MISTCYWIHRRTLDRLINKQIMWNLIWQSWIRLEANWCECEEFKWSWQCIHVDKKLRRERLKNNNY